MSIRVFYEYCRQHDLLTTAGMERNLHAPFNRMDYATRFLHVLNFRFGRFWTELFKGHLMVNDATKLEEEHRMAYLQVLNAFGYHGRRTRAAIRIYRIEAFWGDDGELPEFGGPRRRPMQRPLPDIRLQILDADHPVVPEGAIEPRELRLMKEYLWFRRKPTADRSVTDVMLMDPLTSRLFAGFWSSQQLCVEELWRTHGTNWRYRFKLKRLPGGCPPPLQIVDRVEE